MKNLLLFLFLSIASLCQAQYAVQGTVVDIDNQPLIGARVQEKGTNNGAITDINGTYNIQVSESDASLIISYIGYLSQEIQLNGQVNITTILEVDASSLDAITVVGSRNLNRSVADSPVAIDVIDATEVANTTGRVEINTLLQYAAPSFNATKQSGSDGADHIDPASLRGLGPDQTLVLINGKRRHQSSLINVFGTRGRGNTGTDLNAIPVAAIQRIEILRDGASAQYGSDAIAGVINIVLKEDSGLSGGISYGAYSTAIGGDYAQKIFDTQDGWEPPLFNIEGENRIDGEEKSFDGNTAKIDVNYGTAVGEKGGFINFTGEFLDKQRTLRPGFEWRQGYGSAAADQFQFMLNTKLPISEKTDFYAFGGLGDRDTDAYAFSRGAPGVDGDDRSVASLYPNGFTPHITSNISDNNITAGISHKLTNGWVADFSQGYGKNDFEYTITGTNNASLGANSPTTFDAGGHNLSMLLTSLDLTKFYPDVANGFNLAFGAEYRSENFEIFAGEEASYATYDVNGMAITNPASQTPFVNEFGQTTSGGSQGFPGYQPANEVDERRSNVSLYVDSEINPSTNWLIGGAVRFENYNDFGSTLNAKIASRYDLNSDWALRGSASTGFRAPSLAQVHYNLLFNNIIAGRSERTLLASNTSEVARAFGIEELKEETALNFAGGVSYGGDALNITLDAYLINVDDRIVLTDVFDASGLNVNAQAAQFFTNGIDTRTTGLDAVVSYEANLANDDILALSFAGNINDTKILNVNSGNLNEYTFFGPFSRAYLEAAAPDYKLGFQAQYLGEKISAMIGSTLFSEVIIQDFQWVDTPATNAQEAEALYAVATDTYEAKGILDASFTFNFSKNLRLTFGGNNLLNTYPTQQFDGWTDQGGFNDSVQMGSDGMYLFSRFGFNF